MAHRLPHRRQRDRLAAIARADGRPQSAVIREAIDRFLEQDPRARREAVVRDAAGIWRDRSDVPTLTALRETWDRESLALASFLDVVHVEPVTRQIARAGGL